MIWPSIVDNRLPPRSNFDESVIGGVKLEGKFLRVLNISVLQPMIKMGMVVGGGWHLLLIFHLELRRENVI